MNITDLVKKYHSNRETYLKADYNETQLRTDFLDPLFEMLDWDMELDWEDNEYRAGLAPLFRTYLGKIGDDSTLEKHFERNIDVLSKMMLELHEAGVSLLLGSDAFGALVPGFAPHQELELMVAAGLTPYEALQTGTVNVAAYLGEADSAGTVETGKRADFVLLATNPLDDVSNATQVRGVFTHATWHSATELEARMARVKEHSVGDQ